MEPTKQVQKRDFPQELTGLQPAGTYSFDQLYRLAQVCHASGLYEDVTDAAQAMIKIMRGQEMGIPPTAAMTAFDLIKKRLFIKPWAIAAKINACGYGGYQVLAQTPSACTIAFMRKYPGRGWVDLPTVTYTLAEAEAHGLVQRSPHWKASPAHMLYQRCMGRGGAMYFPELLAGLQPPPDDTPIPPERHRQNIVELFGDGSDMYAVTSDTPKNARDTAQEARTGGDATPESSQEADAPLEAARGPKPAVDPITGEVLDAERGLFDADASAALDRALAQD